ncbi:MAG: Cytochrome-c peroxidase [Phycisphaerales bacterium]|nr:Cytochrome-c peroxidase [Phycisphaerales bacterium]
MNRRAKWITGGFVAAATGAALLAARASIATRFAGSAVNELPVWKGRADGAPVAAAEAGLPWEVANPLRPLPEPPAGLGRSLDELKAPPTPESVRLGRWLFFDTRLSLDHTVSCATCHRPAFGFSEPTPVSTGVHGRAGTRKAPPLLNLAWPIYPAYFWDGRAATLEEQALGPVANSTEMGNTHDGMIQTLSGVSAYAPYFAAAFGDPRVTVDRVAHALADYERTRFSGNSPWDRWKAGDEKAVGDGVKRGDKLFFFGKASCNQCHLGPTFTDSRFHNLGVGFDAAAGTFKDEGRYAISKRAEDRGAFKTPTLRDVARRAPYMHDGSKTSLRGVVEFYNRGGTPNPHLSPKIKPLELTATEVDDLVALLEALNGEGYQDDGPGAFPK